MSISSTIIYSDEKVPFTGRMTKYENMDATKHYLTHYENQCYLEFIARHPETTMIEKAQARKELVMCSSKLQHWKRHPNWNQKMVEEGIKTINKGWNKS